MKWYLFLLIVIISLMIFLFIIIMIMHRIIFGRAKINQKIIDRFLRGRRVGEYAELISEGLSWYSVTKKEDVFITSHDGLKLKGYYIENPIKTNKIIILVHGFRSRCDFDFSVGGRDFYLNGFNLLYIDHRAHNESEGKFITFGIEERYDLKNWIKYIDNRFNGDVQIILSGISMGSATVMYTLGFDLPTTVKGAICDCGFSSPLKIVEYGIKNFYHIPLPPKPLARIVSLVVFMRTGKFLGSVHTKNTLKNCQVPILFIHGENDGVVPVEMTRENYEYVSGKKEILIIKGARHGTSYLVAMKECQNTINKFLVECFAESL